MLRSTAGFHKSSHEIFNGPFPTEPPKLLPLPQSPPRCATKSFQYSNVSTATARRRRKLGVTNPLRVVERFFCGKNWKALRACVRSVNEFGTFGSLLKFHSHVQRHEIQRNTRRKLSIKTMKTIGHEKRWKEIEGKASYCWRLLSGEGICNRIFVFWALPRSGTPKAI